MRKLTIAVVLVLALFGAGYSSHEAKNPTTTSMTTAYTPLPPAPSTDEAEPLPKPAIETYGPATPPPLNPRDQPSPAQ